MTLWSRQPCDDDRSWQAFQVYRDQHRRDLFNVHVGGILLTREDARRYYETCSWKERVTLYDMWLDEIRLEERATVLREAVKKDNTITLGIVTDLQEMARREAVKLLEAYKADGHPAFKNPLELAKFLDTIEKLKRLILGDATERVENTGEDFSKLSPEECRILQELLGKIRLT